MTQLRRARRAPGLSHRRKLKDDTATDDETACVFEDVGLFVEE